MFAGQGDLALEALALFWQQLARSWSGLRIAATRAEHPAPANKQHAMSS